jgi:hypothetical protein
VGIGGDVDEYQRPWAFPERTNDPDPKKDGNYVETPLTTSGPYRTGTMPHELLENASAISNSARVLYEDSGCPADTDLYNEAFVLHQSAAFGAGNYQGTNPLGDPVVFSAYLIGQIANNPKFVSNFNLDADRGYGYLCWDWVRTALTPGGAHPTDGQLHVYPPPAIPPEGADGWARPSPAPVGPNLYSPPVELQYPGRTCKENGGNGGVPR